MGHRGSVFLVFLSKVFRVYSYEELATLRPRISTDRSQIAVLTPIGSPDVCTSVDSCLGHDKMSYLLCPDCWNRLETTKVSFTVLQRHTCEPIAIGCFLSGARQHARPNDSPQPRNDHWSQPKRTPNRTHLWSEWFGIARIVFHSTGKSSSSRGGPSSRTDLPLLKTDL